MGAFEARNHPNSRGRRGAATSARPVPALHFMVIFLGVVLSFTGATAYSRHMERKIHEDAAAIIDNASPSVERLGKAQNELRHLQLLLRERGLFEADHRGTLDEIERTRAQLHEEIDAYLRLPTFPGEPAQQLRMGEALVALDAILDRIASCLARDDVRCAADLARRELAAAARTAAAASGEAVALNAAKSRELAKSIEETRDRSIVVAVVLDGVSAVLALVAGYVLFRAVRRHAVLYEAHHDLLALRADELEQFAGRVAHDIVSPLSAATLALALAERSSSEEQVVRARLARARRSLLGIERIIDGLLEFARAGAQPVPGARSELAPVLGDVLDDARLTAEGARVELVVEPFAPCTVACSGGILASLLSNLVGNAVKHLGDCRVRRVTVRIRRRERMVRVEIADTGPGVPRELQGSIFEPYVRGPAASGAGIGLGLATVKRIVETHGGTLGLDSSPGRGSVFWFELPRPAAEARASALPSAASVPAI